MKIYILGHDQYDWQEWERVIDSATCDSERAKAWSTQRYNFVEEVELEDIPSVIYRAITLDKNIKFRVIPADEAIS